MSTFLLPSFRISVPSEAASYSMPSIFAFPPSDIFTAEPPSFKETVTSPVPPLVTVGPSLTVMLPF